MMTYILIGQTPVAEPDMRKWARWMGANDRVVFQDHVGPYFVSTVFLGLDHNYSGGEPILFETAIFRDADSDIIGRYRTWLEAEAGHQRAVAEIIAKPSETPSRT